LYVSGVRARSRRLMRMVRREEVRKRETTVEDEVKDSGLRPRIFEEV